MNNRALRSAGGHRRRADRPRARGAAHRPNARDLLASLTLYNQALTEAGREVPAGRRLLEVYGPVHRVVLPDGSEAGAPVLSTSAHGQRLRPGPAPDGSATVADAGHRDHDRCESDRD